MSSGRSASPATPDGSWCVVMSSGATAFQSAAWVPGTITSFT